MTNQAIVITAHQSTFPRPIAFQKGAILSVGRADSEYPDWIWVTTDDGNQGWAPKPFIKSTTNGQATALSDYTATELDTEIGEKLELIEQLNGWAWVKNQRQQLGWIPINSIRIETN